MKRVVIVALLTFVLLGTGNLRAADINYSGSYNGSVASSMMSAMLDFMEWFLGARNNSMRNPYPAPLAGGWNNPSALYGRALDLNPVPTRQAASNPYRYRDYWDDPANPWVDMQTLDGTWLAQSGEHWYVRGNRFILVNRNEEKTAGEFIVEGNFIIARLPGGEVEFEFRQMDDAMMLRDVSGRIMLLRRIEAGDWSW